MDFQSEPDLPVAKTTTLFLDTKRAPSITVEDESMDEPQWQSESDVYDEEGGGSDSSQGPAKIIPLKKVSSNRPDPEDILPTRRKKRNNHKIRVPGGHAPTFKPIKVDYDSEDALLVDMKQRGFKDEEISNRLIEEGYTQYDPKSIASRWVRIRKKIQAYEEKLLDEELTDWHIGEDDLLREAVLEADEKVGVEIEKVQNRRFEWAAQHLNKRSDRPRFSARACKDRFQDLENGTARCPPELDPDPEGRKRERDQRLADFKRLKKEAAEKAAVDAVEKKKFKRANNAKRQAAAQRKEAEQQIREQKKKEEEEYRQSRVQASEKVRKQRKVAQEAAQEMRKYKEEKFRVFVRLHKKLRREADALKKGDDKFGNIFPLAEGAFEGTGTPGKSRYAVKNTQEEIMNVDFSATEAAINARAAFFLGQAPGIRAEDVAPLAPPPPKRPGLIAEPVDYGIFGEEPRSFFTIPELHDLLRSRKMLLNRMKETKGVMISRLKSEDESLSRTQLKDLLRECGAPTNGSTKVLLRRLAEEDAKTSRKYKTKYLPQPVDEYGQKIKRTPVKKTPRSKYEKRYSAYEGVSKRSQAVRKKAAAKPSEKKVASQPYADHHYDNEVDGMEDDTGNNAGDDADDGNYDDYTYIVEPTKRDDPEVAEEEASNNSPERIMKASEQTALGNTADEMVE